MSDDEQEQPILALHAYADGQVFMRGSSAVDRHEASRMLREIADALDNDAAIRIDFGLN